MALHEYINQLISVLHEHNIKLVQQNTYCTVDPNTTTSFMLVIIYDRDMIKSAELIKQKFDVMLGGNPISRRSDNLRTIAFSHRIPQDVLNQIKEYQYAILSNSVKRYTFEINENGVLT